MVAARARAAGRRTPRAGRHRRRRRRPRRAPASIGLGGRCRRGHRASTWPPCSTLCRPTTGWRWTCPRPRPAGAARAHPRARRGGRRRLARPAGAPTAAPTWCLTCSRRATEPSSAGCCAPGGTLLVVTPAPDHLAELVGPLGLIGVDPDKARTARPQPRRSGSSRSSRARVRVPARAVAGPTPARFVAHGTQRLARRADSGRRPAGPAGPNRSR